MEKNTASDTKEVKIKRFTDREVNKQIYRKVDPKTRKSRSGHKKGLICLNGKIVARVKIPNPHDSYLSGNSLKKIADQLLLNNESFNGLIDCTVSGSDYYAILENVFTKSASK